MKEVNQAKGSVYVEINKSTKVNKWNKKAKKLIIVENNVTGQFAKLLRLNTSFTIENKILKFTGMPFSVEEIIVKSMKTKEGK